MNDMEKLMESVTIDVIDVKLLAKIAQLTDQMTDDVYISDRSEQVT